VRLSDLRANLSPDVVELALSLQASVLQPLMQPPPDRRAASRQPGRPGKGAGGLPPAVRLAMQQCDMVVQRLCDQSGESEIV
jgi:hypothetical protein